MMTRTHALLVSLVLAVAVALGSFAAIRSTQLSTQAATPRAPAAQIARQNAALDRAEATLRAELRRKPPAIPPLAATPRVAPSPQTVIYRRAPTVVRVLHRAGGEHDGAEPGGGGDD